MTHRTSVAKTIIINDKGDVLVLRRSEWPEHPERSHQPDFPGGMVEDGEYELAAAVREAEEESGLKLDPKKLELVYAGTRMYEDDEASVVRLLYIARLDTTPEIKISWEHESYEWVPRE
jgi:8-oxo-dGTP pyrophosphatase MutT (NUDIX family)